MERPPEFRPPDPCQGGSSFTTHLQCIFNRTPAYTGRDHCHAQKKFCQRVCSNDPAGGEPRSRTAQQRLPSRKTRPQSAHSDADGGTPHYSRIDNQLNKALVTSCRRPDRGKIPEAFSFLFFSERPCEDDQANRMQVLYYECQTAAESHK